ncbi:MAG: hypothetical protein RMJ98_13620 [Myxococcales bacterium]|nr:hypothetical protein [Polyangiaceae bacterium]MDW8250329.1 hypothetical protein [Myxococcales bacterium]
MRWRFPDPSEEQVRRRVVGHIDAFWASFREREGALRDDIEGGRPLDLTWLGQHLEAVDPSLRWEIAHPRGSPWRLLLTTERHLTPLVEKILERAPRGLPWEFLGARPPVEAREAASYLEQRTGRSLEGWVCRVDPGEHRQMNVCFGLPDLGTSSDREALQAARLTAAVLLGDTLFARWVGSVRVSSLEGFEGGEPLSTLLPTVERGRLALLEQLPALPYFASIEEVSWTLYQSNPRRRPDYPFRTDLLIGKTVNPQLWACAHTRVPFHSERFSRAGETFAYLKMDSEEGFGEGGFEYKSEAEDALDEALIEARLGCVIGGGSGLRYGYIDLALLDVEAAVDVMGRVLREGKAPRRSWLLFFDDELAGEWISFHPRTPPPPGAP